MVYVHPDNYNLGPAPLSESSMEASFQKVSMSHIPYARGEFMTGIAAKHTDAVLGRYIDLNWDNHDFSAAARDVGLTLDANGKTQEDKVTSNFVKALSVAGYGLKDSTVTPEKDQAEAWGFKKPPSPNGVLRSEGQFAVIERPSIKQRSAHQYTIYRLPDGNMYSETSLETKGSAHVIIVAANPDTIIDLSNLGHVSFRHLSELLLQHAATNPQTKVAVSKLKGDTTLSIQPLDHERVWQYARATFESVFVAAQAGEPFDVVILTSKYTIAKADAKFIDLCRDVYQTEFQAKFVESGLPEPKTILSDAMAAKMPAKAFAGKKVAIAANAYDGDWMSDLDNGLNYGPGFGASILIAPVSEKNPKGIYLPEITAGTATDLGEEYLQGGQARDNVKFNPAAMIDAKLKVLGRDASVTTNVELGRIVDLARESFFDHMINDEGELVHRNYDETMKAWSAKLDALVVEDPLLSLRIRGELNVEVALAAPAPGGDTRR